MSKNQNEMEEYVLVFPSVLLKRIGDFQGLSFDVDKYMRRQDAETDFEHKQLIPYVILHHQEKIFTYRRGKLLAEKRLMGNYSIGVGGHISVNDPALFGTTYQEGLKREVAEEINIQTTYNERIGGLINDDSNEVGRVHFGIIHTFSLAHPLIKPREKSINETGFWNPEELIRDIDKFENWSKICINGLDSLLK
ncbi:MAG: phosphoesterase [Bacteroidota bacterium]|nr:phosphoesterase [Bacteroidota bacterium]